MANWCVTLIVVSTTISMALAMPKFAPFNLFFLENNHFRYAKKIGFFHN
jgi:hypothetical protein